MDLSIVHIWASMGLMSRLVAFALVLMAIASIGVVVERWMVLVRADRATRAFSRRATPLIEAWELERLAEVAEELRRSFFATLVAAMTRRFLRGIDDEGGGLSAPELARREAQRRKEVLGAEMRRGLSVLATVGSIAPFVGLLGTVVGIITAFEGIAATGSGGLGAVSAGIAEALIVTALGLFVAIPSVLCWNQLSTKIARVELSLERASGELLDEMENEHGRISERRIQEAA